jgi:hypothetical protein
VIDDTSAYDYEMVPRYENKCGIAVFDLSDITRVGFSIHNHGSELHWPLSVPVYGLQPVNIGIRGGLPHSEKDGDQAIVEQVQRRVSTVSLSSRRISTSTLSSRRTSIISLDRGSSSPEVMMEKKVDKNGRKSIAMADFQSIANLNINNGTKSMANEPSNLKSMANYNSNTTNGNVFSRIVSQFLKREEKFNKPSSIGGAGKFGEGRCSVISRDIRLRRAFEADVGNPGTGLLAADSTTGKILCGMMLSEAGPPWDPRNKEPCDPASETINGKRGYKGPTLIRGERSLVRVWDVDSGWISHGLSESQIGAGGNGYGSGLRISQNGLRVSRVSNQNSLYESGEQRNSLYAAGGTNAPPSPGDNDSPAMADADPCDAPAIIVDGDWVATACFSGTSDGAVSDLLSLTCN